MRARTNKIVLVGGMVTLAIVIGIIVASQKERSPVVSNPNDFLPCEAAPDPDVEWPCTVTENGRFYAVWDGMKFNPALAPTPFPVPYKPQSIHPDVLDRAERKAAGLREARLRDLVIGKAIYAGLGTLDEDEAFPHGKEAQIGPCHSSRLYMVSVKIAQSAALVPGRFA